MIRMAIVLLLAAAAIPAATFWHEAQQNRSVDKFLRRADQLEAGGKSAEALVYLDRYLRVRDNVDVRVRLCRDGRPRDLEPASALARDGDLSRNVATRAGKDRAGRPRR